MLCCKPSTATSIPVSSYSKRTISECMPNSDVGSDTASQRRADLLAISCALRNALLACNICSNRFVCSMCQARVCLTVSFPNPPACCYCGRSGPAWRRRHRVEIEAPSESPLPDKVHAQDRMSSRNVHDKAYYLPVNNH
jgi:hypothetical protein